MTISNEVYRTRLARAWTRVALALALALALVVASSRAIAQPAPTSPAGPPSAPIAPAPNGASPAPAPATLVPVAPAAPVPVATKPSSDRQWLKDVYEKSADSVVLIETEHGSGSGFFYYSNQYVATALHVVDDAEVIVVSMSNGQRTYGSVVAYSRNHDVALVELVHPFPDARVLVPYRGPVAIGETVAVIGHPFSGLEKSLPRLRGLLNWSLTEGVVGAVAGSWIQTDAAINPGNSGGPVLNERGEVLGVVSAKLTDAQGIGMIARVKRVDELVPKIGQMSPPRQRVQFDGIDFGFVVNWLGDESIDGFAIGSGVRVVKRYPIRFRLGFLGGTIEPSAPTVLESRLQRFSNELTFGYALPLGDYLELSPYLGAAFFYDWRKDSALQIDGNLACPSPPCLVEGRVLRSTDFDFRLLPMLGATLDLGHLTVSYAYEFDLSDLDASEHRVLVGLKF